MIYCSLYYSIYSDYVNQQNSVYWIKTSSIYSVWRALFQGLKWGINNMDEGSNRHHLSFARRASVACYLASHVSGWFSRPDNNHDGWRQTYGILDRTRSSGSPMMLNRKVFAFTASNTLSSPTVLENEVLGKMLPYSFVPIARYTGAGSAPRPSRAARAIDATVTIAPPPAPLNEIPPE